MSAASPSMKLRIAPFVHLGCLRCPVALFSKSSAFPVRDAENRADVADCVHSAISTDCKSPVQARLILRMGRRRVWWKVFAALFSDCWATDAQKEKNRAGNRAGSRSVLKWQNRAKSVLKGQNRVRSVQRGSLWTCPNRNSTSWTVVPNIELTASQTVMGR